MNAKSLGIFAFGSLFGALVGVVSCKKYYEKRSDEEIASIKRDYTYKKPESDDISEEKGKKETKFATLQLNSDDNFSRNRKMTSEEEKNLEEKLQKVKEFEKQRAEDLKSAQKIIDYTGYSGKSNEKVDPAEEEHPLDDDSETDEPFEITVEEAGYGRTCVTTTYFVNNNVLVEGDMLESIDISESIGHENLEKCLQKWEEDPNAMLYFRNNKIGLDYEVLMSDEDYNELARAWNGIETEWN